MDKTYHYLSFTYAFTKSSILEQSVDDWLQCGTCHASVSALDASVTTSIVTQSLEEFGVMVCQ